MCHCAKLSCDATKCDPRCCCQKESFFCCFSLGCKPYFKNVANEKLTFGHDEKCSSFKRCYCLALKCKETHHELCTCDESCSCEIYQCPKTCCPLRKQNEACSWFEVELCSHCHQLRNESISKVVCRCKEFKTCETHKRKGWNLQDWQNLRQINFFTKTPKVSPYYHEKEGIQITTCDLCSKESILLDSYYCSCQICMIYVCKHPVCACEFMTATEDVDYDFNGCPYYAADPWPCNLEKKNGYTHTHTNKLN